MVSPMNAWNQLRLSATGRPVFMDGEEDVMMQGQVFLYDGDEKSDYPEGTIYLTTHRVLFLADQEGERIALALPLAEISMVEYVKRFLRQSPKVVLHTRQPYNGYIKLSFRGPGHTEFFRQTQLTLAQAKWKRPPPGPGPIGPPGRARGPPAAFDPSRAGIAGIQRAKEEEWMETERELSEAFDDLKSLMAKAKDMVSLAKRLQAKLSKQVASDDETAQFKTYLLGLGLLTPVTKDIAGTEQQYFRELARELADFLLRPLEDQGGIMALTDIYCLYNRARGSQLISPDDLLNACRLFEHLNLPVRLHTYPSGVIVVQALSQTEDTVAKAVGTMFKYNVVTAVSDCVVMTAMEYAQLRKLPLTLAKEHLVIAERFGVVCRDDTVEGISFYTNVFATMVV